MIIPEQAVEAAARALMIARHSDPDLLDTIPRLRESVFTEARAILTAALPLMGVQRPEDVARVTLIEMRDHLKAGWLGQRDVWVDALDAILALPQHTGQEGARRCICSLAPCQSYHGDARGLCLYCDHYAACHASPPPPVAESGWQERVVPIADWKIVADEPVLIYVVHTNAEFEKDENRRQEEWEGWTVGRWITHNNGGWMYYGMMGRVTHVAPLPAPPHIAEERQP